MATEIGPCPRTGRRLPGGNCARDQLHLQPPGEDDRRHRRREARLSVRELRGLYHDAPVGMALLDRDFRYVRVNTFLARMNGVDVGAHIGRSIFDILPDLLPHEGSFRQVLAAGESVRDLDVETATARDPQRKATFRFHCYPVGSERGVTGVGIVAQDITAQKRAERAQDLLRRELNHRIKNLFSIVSTIVTLSTRGDDGLVAYGQTVRGRIDALAKAQDLAQREWQGTGPSGVPSLQTLLRTLLEPYRADNRPDAVRIMGDDAALGAHATTGFALAFHELATNAAKYGALSNGRGQVSLSCALTERSLSITWQERGGPPVAAEPKSYGFGSVLARRILVQDLGGAMQADWSAAGLTLHVILPREALAR